IPHDKDPENSRRKNDPLQPIQHGELPYNQIRSLLLVSLVLSAIRGSLFSRAKEAECRLGESSSRALIEEGLKRDDYPPLVANVESKAKAVRRLRSVARQGGPAEVGARGCIDSSSLSCCIR